MNEVLWGTHMYKNTKVTFGEDYIVSESEEWKIIYPYGFITKISYSLGSINISCKDNKTRTLLYINGEDRNQKKHIKEIVRRAQSLTYNKPFKARTAIPKEHYKRCNVCGHLFCYTAADLDKNLNHQLQEEIAKRNVTLDALSLNTAAMGLSYQTVLNERNQIVDYDKCPSCGSKNLRDITLEEFKEFAENAKNPTLSASTLSAADELKKYKDLFDSGTITQEEFNAKKKQLLNL